MAVRTLPFDTHAFEYLTDAIIIGDADSSGIKFTDSAHLLGAQRRPLESYNQEEYHDTN